ncbi:hypothetical protein KFK09_017866 [Dendrobium nobile]|uniref:Myb/SANT-like domain-containing protein n=1 Tax=Dendrobium nobile TaxID=94219 RepID=A0A8T3AU93_DENNO|nr:hypothetical protein KFK09_017866 [Dendrobium nobile]
MQKFLKGKGVGRATGSKQRLDGDDISIYSSLPKSTTQNPKWPEDHNVILGELLLEQYVNGNVCNGNMRKEQWASLVVVLNRRLRTNYTDSSVMIRFKNMKADFRTLYQLTNRSGWSWDEELHIPVDTDELWDEIQQVNPKAARFRRYPFHQYEIFEKICAENIAVGNEARCTKISEPVVNLNSEKDAPHIEDDFPAANGVSYDMNETPPNDQTRTFDVDPSVEMDPSPMIRTKRSSEKPTKSAKCPKRNNGSQNLNELLLQSNRNTILFRETIEKIDPYSMRDCLIKLGQFENLTTHALIAIQDALKESKDNKAILMTWEGDVLVDWIEYIVNMHPRFYASKV